MASRADLQVVIRLRDRELPEEDLGHVLVVMLAGVDDRDAQVDAGRRSVRFTGVEGADDRRDLHEVGARPGDDGDGVGFHRLPPITARNRRRGRKIDRNKPSRLLSRSDHSYSEFLSFVNSL